MQLGNNQAESYSRATNCIPVAKVLNQFLNRKEEEEEEDETNKLCMESMQWEEVCTYRMDKNKCAIERGRSSNMERTINLYCP